MARFWWVNHKKTFKEEIAGGYLWSPKTEASGARSQFYDNLILTRPGDGVVSYAKGFITALGVVSDLAVAAPKPSEFASRGSQWSHDGWLVPVVWHTLSDAVRPKDFISSLAPLLPPKYSPLQRESGNGNQKAYLSEVSEELFRLVEERVGGSIPSAAEWRSNSSGSEDFLQELESAIEKDIHASDKVPATEKSQLVLARRGQGLFRRRVSAIEAACRCTGISEPELLIASHIKPWRWCETGQERLDGNNGLLLSPNADHLFDRGLMSFADDGGVLVSSAVSKANVLKLGISVVNVGRFLPAQTMYLAFHRAHVFLP